MQTRDEIQRKRWSDMQNSQRDDELFRKQRSQLEQVLGKLFVDFIGATVQDNFPVEPGTVRRLRLNPIPIRKLMDAFQEFGWTETFLMGQNKNLPVDPRLRKMLTDL